MRQLFAQLIRRDIIGTGRFVFDTNNAFLNQLHMHKDYRCNGYGTYLMRITEQYLFHKYNVQSIHALVWEPQFEQTSIFYEKNGYVSCQKTPKYYDDGNVVYELLSYKKTLNPRSIHLPKHLICNDQQNIHFTDYIY